MFKIGLEFKGRLISLVLLAQTIYDARLAILHRYPTAKILSTIPLLSDEFVILEERGVNDPPLP